MCPRSSLMVISGHFAEPLALEDVGGGNKWTDACKLNFSIKLI